jgi:hypothetical protein
LLGAADLVLKIADKAIKVEKNKDGQDGDEFPFELRWLDLGIDDEGDPISTCVVEIADDADRRAKRKRPRDHTAAGKALQQLEELIIEKECERVIGYRGIPDHADVVNLEVWRQRCRRKGLSPGSTPENEDENENRTFRRGPKRAGGQRLDWHH